MHASSFTIRSRRNFLLVCQLMNQILWQRCRISGHHLENCYDPVSRVAGLYGEHLSVFCVMLFPGLESRAFLVTSSGQASRQRCGALLRFLLVMDPAKIRLSGDALKSRPLSSVEPGLKRDLLK